MNDRNGKKLRVGNKVVVSVKNSKGEEWLREGVVKDIQDNFVAVEYKIRECFDPENVAKC